MSRNTDPDLPPELRSAQDQENDDASPSPSDLEVLWQLLDRAAPPPSSVPNAEETWEEVRQHIEGSSTTSDEAEAPDVDRRAADRPPRSSSHSRRGVRRTALQWGGALAALLVIGLVAWMIGQPAEVTAPSGTSITRTLPDGSTVELNSGSRLTYPRTFASLPIIGEDARPVRLQGEAFFEVEPDDKPFLVHTSTASIEVVGTSFTVRSWNDERNETHVALAEGRLRVKGWAHPDTAVTLHPGQALHVSQDGPVTAPRDTSIERIMAWRRGGFAVTGRPLTEIVRALERRSGAQIRMDASISQATRSAPMTLYYPQAVDLETILHDVCMARDLSYRSTTEGYILTRAEASQSSR